MEYCKYEICEQSLFFLNIFFTYDDCMLLKKQQASYDKAKIVSWYIEQSKKDFDHAEDVILLFINFVCKKHAIPSITVVTKNDCFGVRSVKRLVSTIKFRGTR